MLSRRVVIATLVASSYIFWMSSGLVFALVRQPVPSIPVELSSKFESDRAFSFTAKLATEYPRRVVGSNPNRAAAEWMASVFESYGLEVILQNFSTIDFEGRKAEGMNVIAVSQGTYDELLVLMAHRDVVPTTEQGADDNASGSGVLLELARVFASRKHNYTIVFISTDSEEVNLQGASEAFDALKDRSIAFGLSVDQLGSGEGEPLYIYAYSSESVLTDAWPLYLALNLQAKLGFQLLIPEHDQILQRLNLSPYTSDSEMFVRQGVPAFAVGEYVYPEAHTPNDTIDRISVSRLAYAGAFIESLVVSLDEFQTIPSGDDNYLISGAGLASREWILIHAFSYVTIVVSNTLALLLGARGAPMRGTLLYTVKSGVVAAYLAAAFTFVKLLSLWVATSHSPELTATALLASALLAGVLLWKMRRLLRFTVHTLVQKPEETVPNQKRAIGATFIGLAALPYIASDPLTGSIMFGPLLLVATQGAFFHSGKLPRVWAALIIVSLMPLILVGFLYAVSMPATSTIDAIVEFLTHSTGLEFYSAVSLLPVGLLATLQGRIIPRG